jgi:predicted PurR-regulated permease PerM
MGTQKGVRIAIGAGLSILFLLLLRFESEVFFTVIGGILFSVALRYPSQWIGHRLGLPYKASLVVFVAVVVATTALGAWLLGAQLNHQLQSLFEQLPKSLPAAREWIGRVPWLGTILGLSGNSAEPQVSTKSIVVGATSAVSSVLETVVAFVAIFFIGVYGAAQPDVYTRGLLKLLPKEKRPRTGEVLASADRNLARWLVGRVIAMSSVAVITAIGLRIAGIPLAIPLGLVAGLLTFVEYLGAVLSFAPAALIALAQKPSDVLWVALVFTIAHVVEGYVLTPFITRGTVRFPPAFTLGFQLLLGALFGVLGLTFATPVAVIAVSFVQKLYVEDYLGDRSEG